MIMLEMVLSISVPLIYALLDFYKYHRLASPGFILNGFLALFLLAFAIQYDSHIDEKYLSAFYWYVFFCALAFFPLLFVRNGLVERHLRHVEKLEIVRFVLLISASIAALGIVGTFTTPAEIRAIGQQSGLITIFYFASSFAKITLICVLVLLLNKHKFTLLEWAAVVIAVLYYLDFIFFLGKRTGLYEVLVVYLLYVGNKVKLRNYLILGILSLSLVLLSIFVHEFREYTKQGIDINTLYAETSGSTHKIGTSVEIEYAIYMQAANSIESDNVLNLSKIWNNMVSVIIPAQFLGDSFKNQFYLDEGVISTAQIGYIPPTGSAVFFTGELYASSSYLGPFLVLLLAFWIVYLSKISSFSSLLVYITFIMAIPYLLNFGIFGFVFYLIRIYLVFLAYYLYRLFISALRPTY